MCIRDRAAYDALTPIQWPVNAAYPDGRARLLDDGHYFTDTGKGKFIAPAAYEPIERGSGELTLNTGRIRDQWHTMTRTGRAARLSSHLAEPFVEVHPVDAENAGLESADIAKLSSDYGEALVRVIVTKRQQRGSLFMPMHFTAAVSSLGRADALTAPEVCPKSFQPALKATPVKLENFKPDWYGFLVLRNEDAFNVIKPLAPYWAKATIKNGARYEIAGHGDSDEIITALKSEFSEADYDLLDMSGAIGSIHRVGVFAKDGTLIGALYLANQPVALSRDWVCEQLGEAQADARQRYRILAGRPGADMPDKGAIICSCMGVGVNDIKSAIEGGCASLKAVCDKTTAGTNCGSCQPEIRALLESFTVQSEKIGA